MYTLDQLDATKACDVPFVFDFIDSRGQKTGIKFHVLGGQSERVTQEVARLINERRQQAAQREMEIKNSKSQLAEFEPIEKDIEFQRRLASVRLVGWENIADEWSPEGAFRLCKTNKDVLAQVTSQSEIMANFMPASSPSL